MQIPAIDHGQCPATVKHQMEERTGMTVECVQCALINPSVEAPGRKRNAVAKETASS